MASLDDCSVVLFSLILSKPLQKGQGRSLRGSHPPLPPVRTREIQSHWASRRTDHFSHLSSPEKRPGDGGSNSSRERAATAGLLQSGSPSSPSGRWLSLTEAT